MNVRHQDKIAELVDLISSSMKIECQKLVSSGMIDESQYSVDEYALAKILITASMHRLKNDFYSDKHRKEINNLIKA